MMVHTMTTFGKGKKTLSGFRYFSKGNEYFPKGHPYRYKAVCWGLRKREKRGVKTGAL